MELFVASDYAGVVAALASEQIDFAYLGGLTYLQAGEPVDLTPLVTEIDAFTGTPQYESAVIVSEDSPLQSTQELVESGGVFAFGDPAQAVLSGSVAGGGVEFRYEQMVTLVLAVLALMLITDLLSRRLRSRLGSTT